MVGATLAMSICSTCAIPSMSSCGGISPGSMPLSAEKVFGFFLSLLQRLHLLVCVFAEEQGTENQKCPVACSTRTVAQKLSMYVLVL